MNPGGGNHPCGAKEEDRDASDRGKVIPVEKKRKAGMPIFRGLVSAKQHMDQCSDRDFC